MYDLCLQATSYRDLEEVLRVLRALQLRAPAVSLLHTRTLSKVRCAGGDVGWWCFFLFVCWCSCVY